MLHSWMTFWLYLFLICYEGGHPVLRSSKSGASFFFERAKLGTNAMSSFIENIEGVSGMHAEFGQAVPMCTYEKKP